MDQPAPHHPGKQCDPDDALAVLRRLREAGHVAYFAGGCVRDLLLGRGPKDYDVATDAPPGRVRELFRNTQAVGQAFGVILVRHHGSQVEVATFRSDGTYLDGRRPSEVRFTTAEEDARRRDFTINGLFLDPLKAAPLEEQVIDHVGGRADLAAGVVRAIGDPERRFEEDHLRLLRAVRFAARLGFGIEPVTAAAVRRHAPQLARISPERVGEELRAMLTPPTRGLAWRLLNELDLAPVLFRFLPAPITTAKTANTASASNATNAADTPNAPNAPNPSHRPSPYFARVAPGRAIPLGLSLAAAALEYLRPSLPDGRGVRTLFERSVVQKMTEALRRALRISNEESDDVLGTLEGLAPLARDDPPGLAVLKRFLARPTAPLSRDLLAALADEIGRRVAELQGRLVELEHTEYAPPPLITGDDLTAAGWKPGPLFKRVLEAAYDAQLEGRVRTREEAMALAEGLVKG